MEDEFKTTDHGCIVVNGVGVFDTKWVLGTESNICTCGALDEGSTYQSSPLTLHSPDCASTPCPMCLLEAAYKQGTTWPGGGGTTTQSTAG